MGCNCKKNKANRTQSVSSAPSGVTQVTEGMPHILSETEPLYLQRIEICNSCHYRDVERDVCSACGCFIKAKARLTLAKCPLEQPRW